jgi:hypothetical protein
LAANDKRYQDQVIFHLDYSQQQDVEDEMACDFRIEPDENDLDVMSLGPERIMTLTPEIIGSTFLG